MIYGALLGVVFVGLAFGAEMVMRQRFNDQARASLTSAAAYVVNPSHYGVVLIKGGSEFRYQLPPKLQPFTDVYLELIGPSGRPIDRSANLHPSGYLPVIPSAFRASLRRGQSTFLQSSRGGNLLDMYYTPMPRPPPARSFNVEPDVLLVAKSQGDISHALDVFNAALFSAEAFIWLLAVVATWLVSGAALRPIKAITDRAASIADTSDFAGRVPVDTRTAELQTLAVTFNRMLESLQQAYANQQRFLADASHELRTPLTVLQGNLHYLEEAVNAPGGERREALHAARLEADRMGVLVGDLLALSRADAGFGIQREEVELDRVVIDGFRRIQARERALRPGRGLQFRLGRLDEVVAQGDSERLLQLVVILLDNAVKYTPDGGTVRLELASAGHEATISVADSGPGIDPEDREHIFDRFYRAATTRGLSEGSGLGLAIAHWIAEAHGGSIRFDDGADGGTVFEVTLPAGAMAKPEPADVTTQKGLVSGGAAR